VLEEEAVDIISAGSAEPGEGAKHTFSEGKCPIPGHGDAAGISEGAIRD